MARHPRAVDERSATYGADGACDKVRAPGPAGVLGTVLELAAKLQVLREGLVVNGQNERLPAGSSPAVVPKARTGRTLDEGRPARQ